MSDPAKDSVNYETSDLRMRPLIVFSIALLVLTAVSIVACIILLDVFRSEPLGISHPRAEVREETPAPLLQARPTGDIDAHRAAMEQSLQEYRWVDPGEGVVQIPVERAMDLYLERRSANEEQR